MEGATDVGFLILSCISPSTIWCSSGTPLRRGLTFLACPLCKTNVPHLPVKGPILSLPYRTNHSSEDIWPKRCCHPFLIQKQGVPKIPLLLPEMWQWGTLMGHPSPGVCIRTLCHIESRVLAPSPTTPAEEEWNFLHPAKCPQILREYSSFLMGPRENWDEYCGEKVGCFW